MLQNYSKKINLQQEAMIPFYRQKWQKIALKLGPISRPEVTETIQKIYSYLDRETPEVYFYDSIDGAFQKFVNIPVNRRLNYQLERKIKVELYEELYGELKSQLGIGLANELASKFCNSTYSKLVLPLHRQMRDKLGNETENKVTKRMGSHLRRSWGNCLQPEGLFEYVSLLDFCAGVLNCQYDRDKWELLQAIVKYCGWIYTFEGICLACDRPIKLSFDSQQRLHAEGEPALLFADGYSLYSYHGVTLPEKYGKLHPHQWRSQWLLEENNVELRRVLMQGIGYGRICQELPTLELDYWQEYTLLRMEPLLVDREPIYLLKMTCPSTGSMHVLRVPPTMRSAWEAIRWVNWGTAPEEFSVQS